MTETLPLVTAEAVAAAATWAVDLENDSERRRIIQGHRARRVPCMKDGFRATDYAAADAWLIAEYTAAHNTPEGV